MGGKPLGRPKLSADAAMKRIEDAALAGERCPTNDVLGTGMSSTLALMGRVRFEVGTHNWRTAYILTGPCAGKQTAPCPYASSGVYLIMDHKGARRVHV